MDWNEIHIWHDGHAFIASRERIKNGETECSETFAVGDYPAIERTACEEGRRLRLPVYREPGHHEVQEVACA